MKLKNNIFYSVIIGFNAIYLLCFITTCIGAVSYFGWYYESFNVDTNNVFFQIGGKFHLITIIIIAINIISLWIAKYQKKMNGFSINKVLKIYLIYFPIIAIITWLIFFMLMLE